MNREEKAKEVEVLKSGLQSAKAVIFAKNKGLTVAEITSLRRTLAKENATLKIIKNRLMKRALTEVKAEGLDGFLDGATTMTTSEVDPITPAKILFSFTKENEKLEIKGGYAFGESLNLDKLKALSMIPPKEELIGKMLGSMLNPARSLVTVLAAVPRSLVTVLSAVKDKKQS